jgi:hypothetical protein
MASEVLKLVAQIVISHASMTELTPQELLREIKEVHGVLASLEGDEVCVPETEAPVSRKRKRRAVKTVKLVESPEAKAVEDDEKEPLGDPDYMEFMESREG